MKEYITTDTSEIHRIITDCKQLHVNKLDNLEERGTFLGTHIYMHTVIFSLLPDK